jgi:DNA-binding transcriptional MerR regulator
MPPDSEYSLQDLADLAGATPRTIRYYIAQGLLASPGRVGPGTTYTDGHLNRLRLIKRLQREHLPLAEIRSRLAALDDATVATLVEATPLIPRVRARPGASPAFSRLPAYDLPASSPSEPAGPLITTPVPDRSQWDRILLAPDVELHVRRPLARLVHKRVERLIQIARELLEEDQP